MGRVPGMTKRLNYITRFIADGCEPPWQAYVEALFPTFIRLLISFFWLDLFQVFRSFIGATFFKGGGPGHSSGRGSKRRGKPKTFLGKARGWLNWDPYDHAGKAAGDWLDLGWQAETKTSIGLWTFTATVERMLFIFFIADVVTEAWYNYANYLAETEACRSARQGWLYAWGDDQGASGLLDPYPTVCPHVEKSRGPVEWNVNSGGYSGRSGGFSFSAGIEPEFLGEPPSWVQLVVTDMNTGFKRIADWQPDKDGRLAISFHLEPDHGYSIGSRGLGMWRLLHPSVTISGFDDQPV